MYIYTQIASLCLQCEPSISCIRGREIVGMAPIISLSAEAGESRLTHTHEGNTCTVAQE
jgi:hypothetical protein